VWWSATLVAVPFVVGLALLPKRKQAPVDDDETATPPVAVH
jgi:hypothetical protein